MRGVLVQSRVYARRGSQSGALMSGVRTKPRVCESGARCAAPRARRGKTPSHRLQRHRRHLPLRLVELQQRDVLGARLGVVEVRRDRGPLHARARG
eukprot:897445-Prymnesium_polylepis.1